MAKINSGTYTAISTIDINNDPMVIVDADDTTEDASGTTHTISIAQIGEALSEETVTNIKPDGTQSLGSSGNFLDSDHVHPAVSWVPADNGLLAASGQLPDVNGGSLCNTGNLFLIKVWIRQPFTATNFWAITSTAGSGASTQSFTGIWSSSGTLLTGSADIGSTFATVGAHSFAWTTPQNLTTSMGFVWVGFVFNLATTQPTLRTIATQSPAPMNLNLSAATSACAVNGTSVTALANITPSANNQAGNAAPYWVGIS